MQDERDGSGCVDEGDGSDCGNEGDYQIVCRMKDMVLVVLIK